MFTRTSSAASLASGGWSTRLLVAALCAAVVSAAPAAAEAQTVSDPDTVGDVITFDDDDAVVLVPDRTLNDVSTTRLTHGPTRIAVRVEYVDLKKADHQRLHIAIVTNEGVRRRVSLDAYRRHWSGETQMYDGQYRNVRCTVRHLIDYEANVMKVSFPRRCAGSPRWVKFRVGASARGDNGFYADDALRDQPINSQDGNWTSSRRVYRSG